MVRITLITGLFLMGITLGKADSNTCEDIKISAEITNTSLNGLGKIEIEVEGGVEPISYYWISPNSLIKLSEPKSKDQVDLKSGKYLLIVRDSQGCKVNKEFVVK